MPSESRRSGVTFEAIQARTGFRVDPAPLTPAPGDTELSALRSSPEGRRLATLTLS